MDHSPLSYNSDPIFLLHHFTVLGFPSSRQMSWCKKGQFDLHRKIEEIGEENCLLSEITIAELKFGAENSIQKNRKNYEAFQAKFEILPIFLVLDIYAKEKARLKTKGSMLDDFDLLIGATAIYNNLILVTRNISDFDRLEGIVIEDWTSDNG